MCLRGAAQAQFHVVMHTPIKMTYNPLKGTPGDLLSLDGVKIPRWQTWLYTKTNRATLNKLKPPNHTF